MCTYTYIHTNIIQSREEQDTVSGLRPIMVIVSLPLGPAAPASEIDRRVPQGRHNLILHHQYAFNTCLHIGIYDVYTSGMHTCLHMGAAPLSACTRLPHPCVSGQCNAYTRVPHPCALQEHHITSQDHHTTTLSCRTSACIHKYLYAVPQVSQKQWVLKNRGVTVTEGSRTCLFRLNRNRDASTRLTARTPGFMHECDVCIYVCVSIYLCIYISMYIYISIYICTFKTCKYNT